MLNLNGQKNLENRQTVSLYTVGKKRGSREIVLFRVLVFLNKK